MMERCDVHGRFLTVGESSVGQCSTCHPDRFILRCQLCGQVKTNGSCQARHAIAHSTKGAKPTTKQSETLRI